MIESYEPLRGLPAFQEFEKEIVTLIERLSC